MREHCLKSNLLQLSHSMFCKNVARLAVARGCHTWIRSLATAKQATFLQNILWKSCSKFYFKQCSLKKSLKILILKREYMEMCFHGNQLSWAIKHPFISFLISGRIKISVDSNGSYTCLLDLCTISERYIKWKCKTKACL